MHGVQDTADHPLQWRHDERDGVSNRQPHDCLLNILFRRKSKKASMLPVTGLYEGNSPVTGEFPAQRACNAENVSIWLRHHDSHLLIFQHCLEAERVTMNFWSVASVTPIRSGCCACTWITFSGNANSAIGIAKSFFIMEVNWKLYENVIGSLFINTCRPYKSPIHITVTWCQWRIESPATRLFIQQLDRANKKENTKALNYLPFVRGTADDRWTSLTSEKFQSKVSLLT